MCLALKIGYVTCGCKKPCIIGPCTNFGIGSTPKSDIDLEKCNGRIQDVTMMNLYFQGSCSEHISDAGARTGYNRIVQYDINTTGTQVCSNIANAIRRKGKELDAGALEEFRRRVWHFTGWDVQGSDSAMYDVVRVWNLGKRAQLDPPPPGAMVNPAGSSTHQGFMSVGESSSRVSAPTATAGDDSNPYASSTEPRAFAARSSAPLTQSQLVPATGNQRSPPGREEVPYSPQSPSPFEEPSDPTSSTGDASSIRGLRYPTIGGGQSGNREPYIPPDLTNFNPNDPKYLGPSSDSDSDG